MTVADARFAKPIDKALVERLAREHDVLITIEEGAAGGFSSLVVRHLAETALLDQVKFRPMALPDCYIDHNLPDVQYDEAGLNAPQIVTTALSALGAQNTQQTA